MNHHLFTPALVAVLTASLAPVHAQPVAYSSFLPSDAYAPGLSRLSFAGSPGWRFAQPFTAAAPGSIQWIDAGLFGTTPFPDNRAFSFFLYTDRSGAPGDLLGSFPALAPFSPGLNSGSAEPPVRYFPGGASIPLSAGSRYWLGIGSERTIASSDLAWLVSDDSIISPRATRFGDSWNVSTPNPAWQVSMRIVVPSPGTAAPAILASASLLLSRRRRGQYHAPSRAQCTTPLHPRPPMITPTTAR